ncbi:unnamed protein product [Urochloa humidicola]
MAVLMNGSPGPWFGCGWRGLRQGDPLASYLFLFVNEALQKMVKLASGIRHPAADGVAFPVLQYANDTLILVRTDLADVELVKSVLDSFSAPPDLPSTMMKKSTIVQMHTPDAMVQTLPAALGCQVGSFPQTYLGLPLSSEKLQLSAFAPLIAETDRYLCG